MQDHDGGGVTRPLCVIQARLNSTRVPRKMLLTLGGVTLLESAWVQAARIYGAEHVVIAAPAADRATFYAAVDAYRATHMIFYGHEGDESDVLSRLWHCWQAHGEGHDRLVRWTPDDWRKDDHLIRLATVGDVSASVAESVEVIRPDQLDYLYWRTPDDQREHVGHLLPARPAPPVSELPWSLDTQADYDAAVRVLGV